MGRRIVVKVERSHDTAAAEALLAAALRELASVEVDGAAPLDGGLVAYAHRSVDLAVETLEVRQRYGKPIAPR